MVLPDKFFVIRIEECNNFFFYSHHELVDGVFQRYVLSLVIRYLLSCMLILSYRPFFKDIKHLYESCSYIQHLCVDTKLGI